MHASTEIQLTLATRGCPPPVQACLQIIGASVSEPHTSLFNCDFSYISYIMAYGSTPYVGMTLKKEMAATLKVYK